MTELVVPVTESSSTIAAALVTNKGGSNSSDPREADESDQKTDPFRMGGREGDNRLH